MNPSPVPDAERKRFADLLAIALILEAARAEERLIKNYLDENKLIAMLPKLLSIFWTMVKDWDQNGQPPDSILLPTFEAGSNCDSLRALRQCR